jgi:purine-binding chemotaxis protein CheW
MSDTVQLVIFTLDRERYALPIEQVQEIIAYIPPRPLDGGCEVRGVISLRGQIIPVIDLARALGLSGGARDGEIIVIDGPDHLVGLIVDDVDEVHTVNRDALQEMPPGAGGGLGGIVQVGDHLIAVIEVDHVAAGVAPLRTAA